MVKTINFTKQTLLNLPIPAKGRVYYKDTKEKGLSLAITPNGIRTFFIRKRVQGRDERIFLGRFPEVSIEEARGKALIAKAEVADGKNPGEKRKQLREDITFGEMFSEYMERYSKKNKKTWEQDEYDVNRFLGHWMNRKAMTITKQEVQKLHEKIRDEHGMYQANRLFERIRAIFNKAIEWGWKGSNPTQGIRKFKEKSRDRFLQPEEIPLFLEALAEEPNETARDYVMVALLTGARRNNVLSMRWNDISFERKEWRIPETKNGDPLTLPLASQVVEILERRKQDSKSEWVFPGTSKSGHYQDPKKAWQRLRENATLKLWAKDAELAQLIEEIKGSLREGYTIRELFSETVRQAKERLGRKNLPTGLTDVRLHDLRRTLGSWQAAAGVSTAIIGKTLGHKNPTTTAIYARLNLDPVRNAVEQAATMLLTRKS